MAEPRRAGAARKGWALPAEPPEEAGEAGAPTGLKATVP